MSSAQDRSGWLTVEAAARRLGVSPATIKRRIQDRKPVRLAGGDTVDLDIEMIERPQGHEWRVRVIGALPAISSDPGLTDSESEPPSSSVQEQSRTLDILDALLRANADTMDRQAERLERLHDLLWQEAAKRAAAEERAIAADRRADLAERERAEEKARAASLEAERERLLARVDEVSGRVWQAETEVAREKQRADALAAERQQRRFTWRFWER